MYKFEPAAYPYDPSKPLKEYFKCIPKALRSAANVYLHQSGIIHPRRPKKKVDCLKMRSVHLARKLLTLNERVLCLDVEQYERKQALITEIGITRIDVINLQIHTRHLIIKEYYSRRNGRYVADNKDNFDYGTSTFISLPKALGEVERQLATNTHVVGHGVHNDINSFRDAGITIKTNLVLFDTNTMNSVIENDKCQCNLGKLCERYGHDFPHPHNAGNDSHHTGRLFLQMLPLAQAKVFK